MALSKVGGKCPPYKTPYGVLEEFAATVWGWHIAVFRL